MNGITKADWKLFMEKVPEWQERYMAKLLDRYIKLLKEKDKDPSERFWKLEERIKKDKASPGVRLRLDKNEAVYDLRAMIRGKVITIEDLEDFSDELKTTVKELIDNDLVFY